MRGVTEPREPSIYAPGPYDRPPTGPIPLPPKPRPGGSVNWAIVIPAAAVAVLVLMGAAGGAVWFLTRPTAPPPVSATGGAPTVQARTPTRTAAPAPVRKAGETVAWDDGLKATAYSFSVPVAKGAPRPDEPGYTWGAIDVQLCVGSVSVINDAPWYLRYADNTTIEPSSIGYNQFPKPEYPSGDRNVSAGTCTRGWITFAVPANTRPVKVVYSPPDTEPAEWAIS